MFLTRTTMAARLLVDAGGFGGNVRGVKPQNERALADIQDLCDGNVCERVQTTAFGNERIRMTIWGREHIQVHWWLCGETHQALRQLAYDVPFTEGTTFNNCTRCISMVGIAVRRILSSAKLNGMPPYKPGGCSRQGCLSFFLPLFFSLSFFFFSLSLFLTLFLSLCHEKVGSQPLCSPLVLVDFDGVCTSPLSRLIRAFPVLPLDSHVIVCAAH